MNLTDYSCLSLEDPVDIFFQERPDLQHSLQLPQTAIETEQNLAPVCENLSPPTQDKASRISEYRWRKLKDIDISNLSPNELLVYNELNRKDVLTCRNITDRLIEEKKITRQQISSIVSCLNRFNRAGIVEKIQFDFSITPQIGTSTSNKINLQSHITKWKKLQNNIDSSKLFGNDLRVYEQIKDGEILTVKNIVDRLFSTSFKSTGFNYHGLCSTVRTSLYKLNRKKLVEKIDPQFFHGGKKRIIRCQPRSNKDEYLTVNKKNEIDPTEEWDFSCLDELQD